VAWLTAAPVEVRQAVLDALFDEADTRVDDEWRRAAYEVAPLLLAEDDGLDGSAVLRWVGGHYRQDSRFADSPLSILQDCVAHALVCEYTAGRPAPLALAEYRRFYGRVGCVDGLWVERFKTFEPLWPVVDPGEPWTDRLIASIEALPPVDREGWQALVGHAMVTTSRPTGAWNATAARLLAEVDEVAFVGALDGWLEAAHGIAVLGPDMAEPDPHNMLMLSGLLWLRPCARRPGSPPASWAGWSRQGYARCQEGRRPACGWRALR
jgi:hypothetical protein